MLTYFIMDLLCDTLSTECDIAVVVLSVNLQRCSNYLICHSNDDDDDDGRIAFSVA